MTQSPTTQPRVCVLLATFNGGSYLMEQIASLQNQTLSDWVLLVRDDGSSDETIELIDQLAEKDPRIRLLRDAHGNVGVARNFGLLIEAAKCEATPYFAFCDQDDVWAPQKLEQQVDTASLLEQEHGTSIPILVHSDLEVVGPDLRPVHSSFMSYQGIRNPSAPTLATVVFQNHVVGCTLLGNRALLELVSPHPPNVYMHDWWVALCAAAGGVTMFLSAPLVRYRQHGFNQVGAGGLRQLLRPKRWAQTLAKMNRLFVASFLQAHALHHRLADRSFLPAASSQCLLSQLFALPALGASRRLRWLIANRVQCQNLLLTALFYFQVLSATLMQRVRRAMP